MIDAMRATAALLMTLLVAGAARADGANNIGPSLHGIFSRKAGALADFRYSPAIKRSGISWTPETLDKFISDPQAVVPANRMPYAGMANASDRADLIAYLAKASR